jgi:hypothetical protein
MTDRTQGVGIDNLLEDDESERQFLGTLFSALVGDEISGMLKANE